MKKTPVNEPSAAELGALILKVGKARDREAFRALFDHFHPRVRGFIMKQGCEPQLAEDIVQETMVKIWRKAEQFDPARASASTWVFTIARNLRIDLLRKANRPELDPDDPALLPEPEQMAHERISKDQEASRLRDLLTELPAEQQEVLRLAFFEEKAHGEIAEELALPLGTVKSRIRLALKRIRTEFGEIE